ncbi:MAG: hypothetical protein AB1430_04140 [Pseudomonadota bacterium]
MSREPAPAPISADVARFIQSGLSIIVAARGERLVPSIARAAACRVADDLCSVTVLLFADQAERLVGDVARHGRVAVCFSRPSTHETLQIKGSDAVSALATPQDVAAVRRSLDLFAEDLGPMGWEPEFVDALLWRDPAELLAIRFTPEGVYAQTPGPDAGRALKAR